MPISSIVTQPQANQLMSAYRPIAFTVRATATGGGARPPVVYCDIYINNVFYKTLSKTQYSALGGSNSDWYFDIQDACQEVMTIQLGQNGNSDILLTSGIIKTVFCKFRSSGIDSDGFRVQEGTVPIQATGSTSAVSGTGTQSNTIYVVNATLKHSDNQNLSTHLNGSKYGIWSATTYPVTHRTNNYRVCAETSDYFPIIRTGAAPNCLRIHYRLKNTNNYLIANGCPTGGGGGGCVDVSISGSPNLPNGTIGTPYSFTFTLVGTPSFRLIDIVKPSWMTIPVIVSGNSFTITGTPNVIGTSIPVSFTVLNCNSGEVSFSDTINIVSGCVNVGATWDFPDGTVGQPYNYDITLTGTPPFVRTINTIPSWMTATLNGSVLEIRGTPSVAGAGLSVSITVTNCSTGTVTISDTLSVIAGQVDWDFSLFSSAGLFRIVVNNNTALTRTFADSGTLSVNIGDIIEAYTSNQSGGTALVSFSGVINDDDVNQAPTPAHVGPYAVPAGHLHISGSVEPAG